MGQLKLVLGWAMVLALASIGQAQVGLEAFPKLDLNRDWPWWRGVTRDGHALGLAPVKLNPSQNADWAQPIPGRGHGSPIVVGDQVVLITADEQRQVHSMMALDRQSGKQRWQYVISEGGFPEENHPKNTEASPTVASDGERFISAIFHHKAIWVTAVSADGKKEWEQRVASYNPTRYRYGYAASPLIYGDLVIVAYEYDGPSGLVALERKTGKEVWRTDRPGTITFSSPTVTTVQDKDYLLITGNEFFRAYDPKTGKEIWSTPGVSTATCGTVVWSDGIAFASGGYPQSETLAVDIKTGKALWRNKLKSYEQSMVASNGYLYAYADNGFVVCWDSKTGDEKWRHRLTDKISASGVLVGKTIYWSNEAGDLWVFEANPKEYVEVARNKIGDEAFASPAVCAGQIFLRVAKQEKGKRQEYVLRFSHD